MAESNPSSTEAAAAAAAAPPSTLQEATTSPLPRIVIKYCTQCKWMLRAAYLAQELLSTFSTSLGEVSLIPSTGGIFAITITTTATDTATLWDRKVDGGFPETKELKSRVRNVIDPERDLGHVDRALKKNKQSEQEQTQAGTAGTAQDGKEGCATGECG